MLDDGLHAPLGQANSSRAGSGWPAWLIPAVLAVVGAAAAGGWVLAHRDTRPAQGSAVARMAPAPPALPPPPQLPATPPAAEPNAASASLSSTEAEQQSGVKVVRPDGTGAGPGTFVSVPRSEALPPAPDPRLVEKGRYGLLPRRGADGARPAEVYGRPVTADPAAPAGAPRIALFVGGMGLNRALTAEAARALPPAVTLGFAPYGGDLEQQVAQARALGHEAVLQIPMESYNAPDDAAMPHMLSTGDGPRETLDNLRWQMSRFVGYAGVANFLGGKFTGDAAAFRPVLKDVGDRGLFFFDDGTAARSLALTLGTEVGSPTLRTDVVIDALADPAKVDEALKKLEDVARTKGVAVGSTTGLPTVVDRIQAFARSLPSLGLALVPLSSVAPIASAQPPARDLPKVHLPVPDGKESPSN